MRILHTESFKQIAPLMHDNYPNIHAQMSIKLSPEVASMFADYTQQPSLNGAQWSIHRDDEEHFRPYSEAAEYEQDQIALAIDRALSELKKAFPTKADKLVEVPDSEAIYFYNDGAHVHVVLSEWGFRRISREQSISIIRLCLERAKKLSIAPVVLRLQYADGSPITGQECRMLVSDRDITFTPDANGVYDAGHLKVGTIFRIQTAKGYKSSAVTVDADCEVYPITIYRYTSVTVRVVDKDGTPVSGVNTALADQHIFTDDKGVAVYNDIPYNGNETITVSAAKCEPVQLSLHENADDNKVTLTLKDEKPAPEEDKSNVIEEPQPPVSNTKVRVRILDKKGNPLCSLPVKIFCQQGYEETTTDANGWVYLQSKDLIPGEKPKIELIRPKPTGKRSKKKLSDTPAEQQPFTPKYINPETPATDKHV